MCLECASIVGRTEATLAQCRSRWRTDHELKAKSPAALSGQRGSVRLRDHEPDVAEGDLGEDAGFRAEQRQRREQRPDRQHQPGCSAIRRRPPSAR